MNYGDRRSEFAGIKRQNIDFKRHQILLSGSVLYHPRKGTYEKSYPKNEKARYLPMTPTIEVMLKEYLAWLDAEKEKWGRPLDRKRLCVYGRTRRANESRYHHQILCPPV